MNKVYLNVKNKIKTIVKMHNLHQGHLHLIPQAKNEYGKWIC